MAFFGLFKSREVRNIELKAQVRQGAMKIHCFIGRLAKQADDYRTLARRAFDLDDQQQFRQLASGYLQCRETINRWERYLIRLKALELQKMEAETTRDFLASMNGLVATILNGVQPEDVTQLQAEMEKAEIHSEQLADSVAGLLGDAVIRIDDARALSPQLLESVVGRSEPAAEEDGDSEFQQAIEAQQAAIATHQNSPLT